MTDDVITGPDQLSLAELASRSVARLPIRALIGGAPMNIILTTPVRDAGAYGLGHVQHQQNNTVRWHIEAAEEGYKVIGRRV